MWAGYPFLHKRALTRKWRIKTNANHQMISNLEAAAVSSTCFTIKLKFICGSASLTLTTLWLRRICLPKETSARTDGRGEKYKTRNFVISKHCLTYIVQRVQQRGVRSLGHVIRWEKQEICMKLQLEAHQREYVGSRPRKQDKKRNRAWRCQKPIDNDGLI